MSDISDKDACELLDADHIAVKHLFVDYARLAVLPEPAAGKTAGQRTALAMKICDELTVHAQIEEEIFYPALRKALPDAGALLDKALAEHQQAKQLIADIRGIGKANAAMDTLVAELNVAIENHVKDERDMLFSKAMAAPDVDLLSLADQMFERQQELEAG
ncbi:hemerythrin domain-containing protein [Caenimonas sp. SL110]|uniref:hemerythrin domain-containing protein n=1 Tax=Caenimonas sp. SL110 TaxID=1450524 RepID=UPI000653F9C2|nr:hemerythrin domain-containing protein [Caenimonas sp. SL110]